LPAWPALAVAALLAEVAAAALARRRRGWLAAASGIAYGHILDDRLATKGLIEIRSSETDARAQVLTLSARGRALVPRLAGPANDNDCHLFGVLSKAEQITLRRLLTKLVRSHGLRGTALD
jgi:hypothetical protein